MRKIRNKKFCLMMAIVFAFSMIFPMAAMAGTSRIGTVAVVDGGGNYRLNGVKVTATDVKAGDVLIVALPKNFDLNVNNWSQNISANGDVYYGDSNASNVTHIMVPYDTDNGFNGAPGITVNAANPMFKIEYISNRYEILITVLGTPSTSKTGYFTIYFNNVYVPDGHDGDIIAEFTSPPGSHFDSGTDPIFTLTKDTDADTITSELVEPTGSEQPDATTRASEETVIIMKVGDFDYTINGNQKKADAVPAIKASRTYIPYRIIAEAFDATVQWDAETKTVSISNDEITMFMAVGSKSYTVNGVVHQMDAEAYISNNRILVPVRFVAETLGAAVDWDTQTKVITITRPGI